MPPTPSPSPTPTPTSTSSPTPLDAPSPAPTPSPSPFATPTAEPAPSPTPTIEVWKPALDTSWQWQLQGPIDRSFDVAMYDVDLFDTDAAVVAALHLDGRKVVCYVNAGG